MHKGDVGDWDEDPFAPEHLEIMPQTENSSHTKPYAFTLILDARPLAILFEAAQQGSRLYELMSIKRPAEVLHYVQITMFDVEDSLLQFVRRHIVSKVRWRVVQLNQAIAFPEFDACFAWRGDETEFFEEVWLRHRETAFWKEKIHALFAHVKTQQQAIKESDDFLIQHELKLIEHGQHHKDAQLHIQRPALLQNKASLVTTLPAPLLEKIKELIQGKDIQSVFCPLNDYALWRILVQAQMQRSQETDLPAQEALYLCGGEGVGDLTGADTRQFPNEMQDWGGEVHLPYEGAVGCDLFIKPEWHAFHKAHAGPDGSLSRALLGKPCRYLLSPHDFGELACAQRTMLGEWVLYEDFASA